MLTMVEVEMTATGVKLLRDLAILGGPQPQQDMTYSPP